MTIGTGSFPQGRKFSFNRSYVNRISFSDVLLPVVQTANVFVFSPAIVPTDTYYVTFSPKFWDWSSNMFTLDFLVIEAYRTITPSPTQVPIDFSLTYFPPMDANGSHIWFKPFSVATPEAFFPLAGAPSSYWLPNL